MAVDGHTAGLQFYSTYTSPETLCLTSRRLIIGHAIAKENRKTLSMLNDFKLPWQLPLRGEQAFAISNFCSLQTNAEIY